MDRDSSGEFGTPLQNGAFLGEFLRMIIYAATHSIPGEGWLIEDEADLYEGFTSISYTSTTSSWSLFDILRAMIEADQVYSTFDSSIFPNLFDSIAYVVEQLAFSSDLLSPVSVFYVLNEREWSNFMRTGSLYIRASPANIVCEGIELYNGIYPALDRKSVV